MAIATERRIGDPAPAGAGHPFEPFYRAERDRLQRALAFAVGDPQLAAEAIDEAMARAFQRWERIGHHDDPAGWVYRVALNWARSSWRRRRRLVAGPVPDEPTAPAHPGDPALWTAVDALPDGQRDVVVLRFVLDWSHDRIAGTLGIAPGSARSRLTRGLATLRQRLEEVDRDDR